MEICFGLLQTRGSKISSSWISLTLLCSMMCMWTCVESWSYYYSNTTMNWKQARAWCREHYTDMVAIQNQEEIWHLNSWLPKKTTYYWIGIRKVDDVWTWVGTNKALTKEATNWAKGEPNNGKNGAKRGVNEDCVEMYIKRDKQTGKWNDERCEKNKTALCYTAACKNDSCVYGECVETINSHMCACFEGFYGERCEQVIKCDKEEVTVPYKGSVTCTHQYGNFSYNSSCEYSCEKGYELSVPTPLTCTASKIWSAQPPTCELVQCPELSHPARGSMNCSDPLGSSSYQSTCVFTCDEGFVQTGSTSNTLQCEASGSWNASQPSCVAVQCPAIEELENGSVNCGDADMRFIYGNTCSFSCAPGYRLVGESRLMCTSAAEWSERMPRCEAITCQNPEGDTHLNTMCNASSTELQPGSTCSFSCKAGYELQGVQTIQCSEDGQWSKAIPTCKAIGCPAPEIPTNGHISCSASLSLPVSTETPHPLGIFCTFSCDEGHELEGALSMECGHSGQWNSTPPTCKVVSCPLLEAPENGQINCSDKDQEYNSQCSFTCSQDYSLDGHEMLTCDRNGNWTRERPTCQASPSQVTAIVSGVATGGALLSGLSVAMWILKRLKKKATKFELNSNSDIEAPPQVYKNSTDSLI
ncbi:E-selectin-like [Seriola lalandi dorsalis]|uniref:E-selectin-like n=1 Tax=Seriola lalandi dorsalis TaxID=1841481 RepID=A0A3B4XX74_SERLL|nr:E-selectin-like [Seriola lalandi dorsalis]